ncbi:kinase domain protein [Dictyocaulus viviparus]|uniref:Kinase domain protein n=1 Tax=Dictyocaulus viviparus TaxID=29172 RepID=A0A0D8XCX1_DICVI|nr:kinase domain protein [Dictyocaulus viviparus]
MNFDSKYTRGEFIECGSYGDVCRVTRKTDGIQFALKTIHKSKLPQYAFTSVQSSLPGEIELLRRLDHPHIIKFVESFEDVKSYLLVMELVTNSMDLYEFTVKRLNVTEDVLAHVFSQVADAVLFLHNRDIVHLDVKLENVVIDENLHCKLVDFGSASACREDQLFYYPRCSEPACSPEIWSGRSFYGKDADSWALGVLLYRLCFRRTPFGNCEEALLFAYTLPNDISTELENLFSRIFHKVLPRRASSWEIRNHPWTLSSNRRGYNLQQLLDAGKLP